VVARRSPSREGDCTERRPGSVRPQRLSTGSRFPIASAADDESARAGASEIACFGVGSTEAVFPKGRNGRGAARKLRGGGRADPGADATIIVTGS